VARPKEWKRSEAVKTPKKSSSLNK